MGVKKWFQMLCTSTQSRSGWITIFFRVTKWTSILMKDLFVEQQTFSGKGIMFGPLEIKRCSSCPLNFHNLLHLASWLLLAKLQRVVYALLK